MAESTAGTESPLDIPKWLKSLPLAPTYHPNLAEFQDPISYIYKIEKEASQYGICKIVPPLLPASKNTAINNFNRSVAAQNPNSDSKSQPAFTTLNQRIGCQSQEHIPGKKPVRQSGGTCTLKQFEAKAKKFEKTHLKRSEKRSLSDLEIETLYWKAGASDTFSVEYTSDIPGSAFVPINGKKLREAGVATTVGETTWNMRGVSRAKGSLLRFMTEEIPGVTSPMVHLAMLFSWFAWHVEDHDLHSLNYIHMGEARTWYGVPKEAAIAFEEVVRLHRYGGEVNPLVTCATLADKATIMSPEVLISGGVPCCRLVQNAGEFVVTFPRAYYSGFSHGFNCAEAANIATPEWLKVAKESAIRRAAINYPPLVSHSQLLYALALSIYSRIPLSISTEPRSSRLKERKRGEAESMVKELFVRDVAQTNELLNVLLEQGSSCVLLPENYSSILLSNTHIGSNIKKNCSPSMKPCAGSVSVSDKNGPQLASVKYLQHGRADLCSSTSEILGTGKEGTSGNMLEHGMFSCVACGLLSFACAAVIQPREAAARYLVSADCNFFNDWNATSGTPDEECTGASWSANTSEQSSFSGQVQNNDHCEAPTGFSSLDLLTAAYGNPSDSEEEMVETAMLASADENNTACNQRHKSDSLHGSGSNFICDSAIFPSLEPGGLGHCDDEAKGMFHTSSRVGGGNDNTAQTSWCPRACDRSNRKACDNVEGSYKQNMENSLRHEIVNIVPKESRFLRPERLACCPADWCMKSNTWDAMPNCSRTSSGSLTQSSNLDIIAMKDKKMPDKQRSEEDSSKRHIFCLEHAVEVEKQLRSIGGVHVSLVCHPEYPRVETEAKALGDELGIDYLWKNISFEEATKDDMAKFQSALNVEEAVLRNGDWAVKLGIDISGSLSQSLQNKQMPQNSIVCKVFGFSSPTNSMVTRKRPAKRNKTFVAGKWCGKVWMSYQVHPFLAQKVCQKEENVASFHSRGTPEPNVKIECKSELSGENEQPLLPKQESFGSMTTTVTRKSERKRKRSVRVDSPVESVDDPPMHGSLPRRDLIKTGTRKSERKRKRTLRVESPIEALDDSPSGSSPRQDGMFLRKGQMKRKMAPLGNNRAKNISRYDPHEEEEEEEEEEARYVKSIRKKQTTKASKETALVCSKYMTVKEEEAEYECDMDECTMVLRTKQELVLHKRNICLVDGCDKRFLSHKYLMQHKRVHTDDRPLKCPWKGCMMTFKWAWARTEHIRVHTGVRPYECQEPGCGQTFRFVTDFSRHRRKTGHAVKKYRG